MPDNGVMSITHDPQFHRTWIGTAKGLVKIDPHGDWERFDQTDGDPLLSWPRTGTAPSIA